MLVTATSTAPAACGGTVTKSSVSSTKVVATATPPMVTVAPASKPRPESSTWSPPPSGTVLGVTVERRGGERL